MMRSVLLSLMFILTFCLSTHAQFPAVIDLGSLDGSEGFQIWHRSGVTDVTASHLGDVNNDGIDDFAIATSPNQFAEVIFGGPSIGSTGVLSLTSRPRENTQEIPDTTPHLGDSISNVGDFNNDGYSDFVIGTTTNRDYDRIPSQEALVFFGGPQSFTGGPIFKASIQPPVGQSSIPTVTVGHAGDFNDDGIDDLIVTASSSFTKGYGRHYVIFGDEEYSNVSSFDLEQLDGSNGLIIYEEVEETLESGVTQIFDGKVKEATGVGDINDDGFDDILLGTASNKNYLIYGRNSNGTDGIIKLSDLSKQDGISIEIIDRQVDGKFFLRPNLGWSIDSAGDMNGDGFPDFVIGAHGSSDLPRDNRKTFAFVLFGGPDNLDGELIDLDQLDGTNGFLVSSDSFWFGHWVNGLGDINGDGLDDIIFGDPFSESEGAAYVLYGDENIGSTGLIDASSIDGSNGFKLTTQGISQGVRTGFTVAGIGDVNHDGLDDLFVGTLGLQSYVVFGQPIPEPSSLLIILTMTSIQIVHSRNLRS